MNILVTGGAGFIGSNFIQYCLSSMGGRPTNVVNLDALTYAGNLANLKELETDVRYKFINGDIRDSNLVSTILEEFAIDKIINFAAESHVDRSIDSPDEFFSTNVLGTVRLLNSARGYWCKLQSAKKEAFRFLHVSTDEVFGTLSTNGIAWNEECKYQPNSPYAASKAASDHAVRSFYHTYGLPTITTNCSNNFGPYQFPEKLIPLIILNAIDCKLLPIYGDGQQVRDWLYVDDHVTAILLALQGGRVGETYNIGGLNEKTNLEVVNQICLILDKLQPRNDGRSYSTQITFVQDRPGHDRRYAIDSTKIRRELGWKPSCNFMSGLETTVNWYLRNKQWVNEISNKNYNQERRDRNH